MEPEPGTMENTTENINDVRILAMSFMSYKIGKHFDRIIWTYLFAVSDARKQRVFLDPPVKWQHTHLGFSQRDKIGNRV